MGYAEPQGRLRITRYVLEHLTTSRSSDAAAAAFSPAELTKIFFATTQRFVNEPVEEIRVAAGNIIKAVMEKQGHFQCVLSSLIMFSMFNVGPLYLNRWDSWGRLIQLD